MKSSQLSTSCGQVIKIISDCTSTIGEALRKTRSFDNERIFFEPQISDLHDPFLMPDMKDAVERIMRAREKQERIVIFGDYDVDGVSSTAMLVRFFHTYGWQISYRLPHRIHDGYGLKSYFFDELHDKGVTLVITVDCGTRDIEVIHYAKTLGVDVIVTDHHAVPENIPEGVPVVNPKRKDSLYPFGQLAGAGVAFKLLHAVVSKIIPEQDIETVLGEYIDFASLGTVADCMPLQDENRIITTLGLKRIKNSSSAGLRKFLEGREDIEGNGDLIGFQIGPRINAAGRMDTPLTALRWLLASEDRCDSFLEEIEALNEKRKEIVMDFSEKALLSVNSEDGILFFRDTDLAHGTIGLIAGKLTEMYNRPSIVLCESHEASGKTLLVASCRSPEWCNLVELLDACKSYFVRYGGHRQAAGFSIDPERYEDFIVAIQTEFKARYTHASLPKRSIRVESIIDPSEVTLHNLEYIDTYKPFGIGNPRPLWLLENLTVASTRQIGSEGQHLMLMFSEIPSVKCLLWNHKTLFQAIPVIGDMLSVIVHLEKNEWNEKKYVQMHLQAIVSTEL